MARSRPRGVTASVHMFCFAWRVELTCLEVAGSDTNHRSRPTNNKDMYLILRTKALFAQHPGHNTLMP